MPPIRAKVDLNVRLFGDQDELTFRVGVGFVLTDFGCGSPPALITVLATKRLDSRADDRASGFVDDVSLDHVIRFQIFGDLLQARVDLALERIDLATHQRPIVVRQHKQPETQRCIDAGDLKGAVGVGLRRFHTVGIVRCINGCFAFFWRSAVDHNGRIGDGFHAEPMSRQVHSGTKCDSYLLDFGSTIRP